MAAFLVILLSTFADAAPLVNISTTITSPLWVPAPQGRGTVNILLNCLFTIAICVWTALHLNIDAWPWFWCRLLNTSKYVASGIFWPEFVLMVASRQWLVAKELRQRIRTHRKSGNEQTLNWTLNASSAKDLKFLFENPSPRECQGLTMEIAFYVVMGGFVRKSNSSNSNSEKQSNSETHSNSEENTLTPEAFLELLKQTFCPWKPWKIYMMM
ncbi:hypothetical protein RUND412_008850 [Rhizina undulata]